VQDFWCHSQHFSVSPDKVFIALVSSLSGDNDCGKDVAMAEKKTKRLGLPKKTYWHLYSLQTLQADKLTKIVNKVLRREYVLIK
jgi:hypothetical protein